MSESAATAEQVRRFFVKDPNGAGIHVTARAVGAMSLVARVGLTS